MLALGVALTACNQNTEQATEQANETNTAEQAEAGTEVTNGTITLQTAKGKVEIATNPSPIAVYDMTMMENIYLYFYEDYVDRQNIMTNIF